MAANRWMSKVSASIKRKGHAGIFSAAAKRHGESTSEYAHEKEHAPGKVGKRARLALAFAKAKH
jgi:hypothetical protein